MSNPSFVAYIDETGDEGQKYGDGSSEFFVICAIVVDIGFQRVLSDLFEQGAVALNKAAGWKIRKFQNAKNDVHRLVHVQILSEMPLHLVYVVAHKPSIRQTSFLTQHGHLYNYLSKFLIQRISWICRDHWHPYSPGDGTVEIIFSERHSIHYGAFKSYMRLLKGNPSAYTANAAWEHIDIDNIHAVNAKHDDGLLAVDFCCGSLGNALEPKGPFRFTDDRYIRPLRSLVFDNGTPNVFGHGFKLWPNEAHHLLETDSRFAWYRSHWQQGGSHTTPSSEPRTSADHQWTMPPSAPAPLAGKSNLVQLPLKK